MSELSNTDDEAYRLALRAELNKLKPSFYPQAAWDEEMDEADRQDEKTLAAMIKAGEEYDAEHPDDPPTPATPEDCRLVPIEEILADHGFPPLDPITPVTE
jgi:hypothetical protein